MAYYNFMRKEEKLYRKLLLADCTDMIFQDDPFKIEFEGFYIGSENNIYDFLHLTDMGATI